MIEYQRITCLLGNIFSRCVKISSFCTFLSKIFVWQNFVAKTL